MPIGRRVAYLRVRRRLSQQSFADRLGKSKSWVDKVERGVRSLERVSTIREIAAVLRVDAAALLGRDVQPAELAERRGGIARIRAALSTYPMAFGRPAGREVMSAERLAREVRHVWTTYQHARYPRLAELVEVGDATAHRRRRHRAGTLVGPDGVKGASMRCDTWKGAALGTLAVLAAMLVTGCDAGGQSEPERNDRSVETDRSMKEVLKEYQPRFEQRRAALAAAAAKVPEKGAGKASCARRLDPRPEFIWFDHTSQASDSYNSPDKGGNVDIAATTEAGTPERIVDDPGSTLNRFAVPPGWLVRGLWITGPQGPLGTNEFKVTSQYGDEPYLGVEKDPVQRLRKILDLGLHKRYMLLYRVTTFAFPDAEGQDNVRADVFLADLEKGDLPCRLVADGHDYDVRGGLVETVSLTPYEDMQTSFQIHISDKLRSLTRP
ncbi:helix-turn-helix domain-containing protein [Micromonospora parastrephiae]|uniref:helix-turn-helix domain-containing protein n=1 Tax=Micromonospora parastrephiae TaxID=2806101 RepID=UPI0028163922|nr:helix-turn-helix domain-containing protein [Micromonospora parastrephiae]